MTMPAGSERAPSDAEARAALDHVLASDTFRSSPQLGAFLRYVVDATLAGRGASLKGYTIAVEALGRDPRFNPQVDPIVRVEATRLRRALERYYAEAGSDDPVTIALPRGSYAPSFTRRVVTPAEPAKPPAGHPVAIRWRPAWAVGAAGAVLAITAAALLATTLLPPRGTVPPYRLAGRLAGTTSSIGARTSENRLPPGNGMPTLAVDGLRADGAPGADAISAGALTQKIRGAFARFDTINVASNVASATPRNGPPQVDYRLAGGVDYGDSATTVRFQLIDEAEGTIAWSRSFAYPNAAPGHPDGAVAEDQIVVALTDALLQSYGVIRGRDHAKQLASPTAADPRYRCVLTAADSFRTVDPAEHNQARACLEALTAADPGFAVGFEFLAVIYYREYLRDLPTRAGEPPALDRALRAALRAVELAPASGRAYQMLFVVQYARHDLAAAFAAGDKAMALNRYDMLTVAEYGARLVMTGEVERGMAMLRRAGEAGGVRPSWHNFYLFLGSYLEGDLKEAASQADQITTDDYPLGLVARAITAAEAGKTDAARRALERLTELQPAWRTDARRLLEKSIYRPEIVDRLLHGLADAGLAGAS
jgi:tetratricopeptide (TPR) repeat protein